MKFVNVFEDSYELYELCKKNGWTDCDYETWYQNGGELEFFEGDPDMIKLDGNVGYFCKVDDTVFFYFDDYESHAEMMLKAFYSAYKTGITIGGESWIAGKDPEGVKDVTENHWETWKKMDTGFAYRGGAGSTYWISDWSAWLENELKKPAEVLHEEYFAA